MYTIPARVISTGEIAGAAKAKVANPAKVVSITGAWQGTLATSARLALARGVFGVVLPPRISAARIINHLPAMPGLCVPYSACPLLRTVPFPGQQVLIAPPQPWPLHVSH